jgi:hypothetical protein
VFDKRPSAGGFSLGQDDFVVIPYTAYQRVFGLRVGTVRINGSSGTISNVQISVVAREGVAPADAIAEVQRIMRIRHGLRLDEPDDFDISTQDQFLQLWDRISQGTFFALIVISSIALMVGGIGVMAIMSISVTERTREIGVRKALGARRAEILFQFLMEATFLTGAPCVRLPRLPALVVLRDRPRVLGGRRHFFRDVPGDQSLPPRPHRSSAIRIATTANSKAGLKSCTTTVVAQVFRPAFAFLWLSLYTRLRAA